MLKRIDQFIKIYGSNWAIGTQLISILSKWGQEEKGVVVDYGSGESPFRFCFPYAREYIRFDIAPGDDDVMPVDGERIPCPDGSVDCLLLFQVLGDIPNGIPFFHEVHRVLRSGGSFLIFETVSYPEHDMPHDYYRIMPSGITWLAEQTDFKCEELLRLGGLFTRFAQLWNIYVLGKLRTLPILGAIALGGVVLTNIAAKVLDRWIPHPSLCSDYVAKFVKEAQLP